MQVDDLKIIRNEIDNSLKEIAKKYGGKINPKTMDFYKKGVRYQ